MLSVNFSYVCFIYAEILEIMSSGCLVVSFSIYVYAYDKLLKCILLLALDY